MITIKRHMGWLQVNPLSQYAAPIGSSDLDEPELLEQTLISSQLKAMKVMFNNKGGENPPPRQPYDPPLLQPAGSSRRWTHEASQEMTIVRSGISKDSISRLNHQMGFNTGHASSAIESRLLGMGSNGDMVRILDYQCVDHG